MIKMSNADINLSVVCPVDGGLCAGVECWYPGEFCVLRQIISEDD